jgi:hypothetical protein
MLETRHDPRHKVQKAGMLSFVGGAVTCTVRNLSLTGAAIEIEGQHGIPDKLTLVVPEDKLRLQCRIVWRSQYRIGVRFVAND